MENNNLAPTNASIVATNNNYFLGNMTSTLSITLDTSLNFPKYGGIIVLSIPQWYGGNNLDYVFNT